MLIGTFTSSFCSTKTRCSRSRISTAFSRTSARTCRTPGTAARALLFSISQPSFPGTNTRDLSGGVRAGGSCISVRMAWCTTARSNGTSRGFRSKSTRWKTCGARLRAPRPARPFTPYPAFIKPLCWTIFARSRARRWPGFWNDAVRPIRTFGLLWRYGRFRGCSWTGEGGVSLGS